MDKSPPVLDAHMAQQWFAQSDASDREFDRSMVATLRSDIFPRIQKLGANAADVPTDEATTEIHKLRGAVASFGFSASARHLLRAENHWKDLSAPDRRTTLQEAEKSFAAGLEALLKAYPHLA